MGGGDLSCFIWVSGTGSRLELSVQVSNQFRAEYVLKKRLNHRDAQAKGIFRCPKYGSEYYLVEDVKELREIMMMCVD